MSRTSRPPSPQPSLFAFEEEEAQPQAAASPAETVAMPPGRAPSRRAGEEPGRLEPATLNPEVQRVADALHPNIRLGTSSWNFPGWHGLVWGREYAESTLSRRGLTAYARHPLLRCVSLDRSFYRPLDAATYSGLAAQVPPGFRFVVKAPSLVTDVVVRASDGRGIEPNPLFLDPTAAVEQGLKPAMQGLGETLGVLVFQVSPLPRAWLAEPQRWLQALERLWEALQAARREAGHPVLLALEVRDAELLTPELAALLKRHEVRYCLGLHDRMPPIEAQLPMLRALWPGPLVCRWNLQRGFKYEPARAQFAPFNAIKAPDPATRQVLAKVVAATALAGHAVFVTVNNKAEGSAPLSLWELAKTVLERG
ncbi:DUF72 domain-containing protein [Aquabacterium sp. A7-Y]|uniref:DUF72 domain-containing protein n=1 Tax=Aquabacterium sp. A7-Y TaxID=1349605 RepID=UPI00223CBB45|nr:DUF72 domain-containing protein [Aquabacterium sp. A7-Y]MCW7539829.1 DUF72 domain-containing protein [Aquabacterium sp. A7-Y]